MDRNTHEQLFNQVINVVYDVYHRSFKSTIRSFKQHGMSEDDLIQEGFYELWKKIPKYDPERGAITTFAYSVVYMGMLNYLGRVEKKHTKVNLYDGFTNNDGEEATVLKFKPDNHVPTEEDIVVSSCWQFFVDALPEREKQIVHMTWSDMGQREIANAIGISQAQVSRILKRTRLRWDEFAMVKSATL